MNMLEVFISPMLHRMNVELCAKALDGRHVAIYSQIFVLLQKN